MDAERLRDQKFALVIESDLNRLILRADVDRLTAAPASAPAGAPLRTILPALAAVAGAVLLPRATAAGAVWNRLAAASAWAAPLYRAWVRSRA